MTGFLVRGAITAAVGALMLAPPGAASAQSPPTPAPRPSTVRVVLASASLPSVIDTPLHFRLRRITLPARQAITYSGPIGFIHPLTGTLEVASDGDRQNLRAGEALPVPASRRVTLRAGGSESAVFLHFVLGIAEETSRAAAGPPAVVAELFRTASPIPGLKPGPYEFSLVRVTFPLRFPLNPPHHRSGAALYYVLAGTGAFKTGDKTEPREAAAHYEPHDLVHQWANPGDTPLVLLQANISQEGVPAVIFEGTAPR